LTNVQNLSIFSFCGNRVLGPQKTGSPLWYLQPGSQEGEGEGVP